MKMLERLFFLIKYLFMSRNERKKYWLQKTFNSEFVQENLKNTLGNSKVRIEGNPKNFYTEEESNLNMKKDTK